MTPGAEGNQAIELAAQDVEHGVPLAQAVSNQYLTGLLPTYSEAQLEQLVEQRVESDQSQ